MQQTWQQRERQRKADCAHRRLRYWLAGIHQRMDADGLLWRSDQVYEAVALIAAGSNSREQGNYEERFLNLGLQRLSAVLVRYLETDRTLPHSLLTLYQPLSHISWYEGWGREAVAFSTKMAASRAQSPMLATKAGAA